MKLKVFSIYDIKAQVFGPLMCLTHKGEALRELSDLVTDQATRIAKHPEDFNIQCLGEYDNVSGLISGLKQPEFLESAVTYVKGA